jgi:hypothetical protein
LSSAADAPVDTIAAMTSNPVGDTSGSAKKVQKISAISTPGNAVVQSVAAVGTSSRKAVKSKNRMQQIDPDPAKCMKSIDEMYEIYLDLEFKFAPKPYMQNQADINYKMRAILVDWLVEIHSKFKLQTSTLFLCVNIMDRFLEREQIVRSKLQLIGVASLLIACKFEEVFPPLVKDCIYITDHAYDQQELLKAESKILTVLDYQVLIPTASHFLIRYLNAIKASERTRLLTAYYSERNLQESESLTVTPHVYAAACVYAALLQQNDQYVGARSRPVWPSILEEMTGLKASDLTAAAKALIKHCGEEPETSSKRKLIATKRKYSLSKYGNVADLILPKIF